MRELERTNGNAEEVAERFRQRALQREALRTASPGPVTMPGAGAGGKGAAANRKGESARPWSLDQLLDFEGPLASLSDARELFDVRPVPANLGGLGGNGAIGYEDPWIKAMDKDEQARLRAGGYDFAQVWGRAIRVAVEGLGVPPLTGNQHGALYGAPAEGAQAMEVGA